jgi:hypothetical protein
VHLLYVHCTLYNILILGSLKNTLCDSSKVLEKTWGATCEQGALYYKTSQEVADIQSTLTSMAEAQNRYSIHCGS